MTRLRVIARDLSAPAGTLQEALAAAADYAKGSHSPSTWRAYESDWKIFESWCRGANREALPASTHTVALFLAAEANRRRALATLKRHLAAIRLMHVGSEYPSPHDSLQVAEVLSGIARRWTRPVMRKAPAVDEEIMRMVDAVDLQRCQGLRDRALPLLEFAGAFRRSELVALDTSHLNQSVKGLSVHIASAKMDQNGAGHDIAIPRVADSRYCPVQALADWLAMAAITTGPVFRRLYKGDKVGAARLDAQSVARVI